MHKVQQTRHQNINPNAQDGMQIQHMRCKLVFVSQTSLVSSWIRLWIACSFLSFARARSTFQLIKKCCNISPSNFLSNEKTNCSCKVYVAYTKSWIFQQARKGFLARSIFSNFSLSFVIFSTKTWPFCWSKREPHGFHHSFLFLSLIQVALRAQHST